MDVSSPNAASSGAPSSHRPVSGVSTVDPAADRAAHATVEFRPADIARRDVMRMNGLQMDAIELMRREPYEYDANASGHLLIMAERGERDDGETLVEGLPVSTLRTFTGRLSFVPHGHRFWGWGKPRVLTHVTYFCIDPAGPLLDPELRFAETEFKPRLYFHDKDLWAIASKLKSHGDGAAPGRRQYVETLSILLGHELLRLNSGVVEPESGAATYVRGGLAPWQRNRVADYVEAHLADDMPLGTLAEVARLSQFHFARAFKQSFGIPPHRYLTSRRIERAKLLLADATVSVTEAGVAVGFGDTSSFTTAFRRHAGITPSVYRRSQG
jgi:AraC-like DNA-binding protein